MHTEQCMHNAAGPTHALSLAMTARTGCALTQRTAMRQVTATATAADGARCGVCGASRSACAHIEGVAGNM